MIFLDELREFEGVLLRMEWWRRFHVETSCQCTFQRDCSNQATSWLTSGENRIKYRCQVEYVKWRCIRRRNDHSGKRNSTSRRLRQGAGHHVSNGGCMKWAETDPLRTPSTCRSIHHTPGIPKMHHRFAFRKIPPAGVHCTMVSQTNQANVTKGSRTQNKNCRTC